MVNQPFPVSKFIAGHGYDNLNEKPSKKYKIMHNKQLRIFKQNKKNIFLGISNGNLIPIIEDLCEQREIIIDKLKNICYFFMHFQQFR